MKTNDSNMDLYIELKEAQKTLKEEEYKLRWSGHTHPISYIRSAQYTVTRHWRNKVEELENLINYTGGNYV